MDLDVQNHRAALIRARQLQVHAAAASNLSHIYGLQTPDAPFRATGNRWACTSSRQ